MWEDGEFLTVKVDGALHDYNRYSKYDGLSINRNCIFAELNRLSLGLSLWPWKMGK